MNAVNSDWEITFQPYDVWEDIFSFRRQLRPIHYAVFTDTFDLHGRLYTGHYGHQGLRKFERQTIRQVTDAGLEHLKGLTNLKQLELFGTQLTDTGLVHLKGLAKLVYLDIRNTQVTDEGA